MVVKKKGVPEAMPVEDSSGFVLPPSIYDPLNKIVRILLPAFATLYFTLSEIWGLPDGKEVVGTTGAIALFFGVAVHVSAQNYKKSDGDVDAYIPKDSPLLDEFPGQSKVTFKVNPKLKSAK